MRDVLANQSPARMLTKIIGGILTTTNSTKEQKTVEDNLKSLKGYGTIDMGCCCDYGNFFVDYSEEKAPAKGTVDYSEQAVNLEWIERIYNSENVKEIRFSKKEASLFTFFFQIVNHLKIIGTVPAIDISAYLSATDERIDGDL